jgi:hypothetical protein
LYECWKLFGRGRFPIFLEGERGFVDMVKGAGRTGCFICSEVIFDKVPASVGTSANPREYINTKTLPKEGMSYLQYFNNRQMICEDEYSAGGCWTNLETHLTEVKERPFWPDKDKRFSKINSVDTSKAYAVVVMREGYEWCGSDDEPENSPVNNFVYIIAEDEITQACDIFIS